MSNQKVTVYTKSPCTQCDATKRWLDERDVEYVTDDATTEENLQFILGMGYKQAPVVTVETDGIITNSWYGFNPPQLGTLL